MTEADSHHINLHGQDQARQEAIHRNGIEHLVNFQSKTSWADQKSNV